MQLQFLLKKYVFRKVDDSKDIDVLFIYFSDTFVRMVQGRLIDKLKLITVRGIALEFFKNYQTIDFNTSKFRKRRSTLKN